MRLRASLHWVFSTLMCFLNERCESHHSPRIFVDSSTSRSVFPILTMGGLWARHLGGVKCMTLHLWAANLKPFLVAHSCMAFTACCRCLSMVSRERPRKQIARSSTLLEYSRLSPPPFNAYLNHTKELCEDFNTSDKFLKNYILPGSGCNYFRYNSSCLWCVWHGIWNMLWFTLDTGRLPWAMVKVRIAVGEIFPIYILISMFVLLCDNSGDVDIINKQSTQCNHTMHIIRPDIEVSRI